MAAILKVAYSIYTTSFDWIFCQIYAMKLKSNPTRRRQPIPKTKGSPSPKGARRVADGRLGACMPGEHSLLKKVLYLKRLCVKRPEIRSIFASKKTRKFTHYLIKTWS
jgi:hypothetical protein